LEQRGDWRAAVLFVSDSCQCQYCHGLDGAGHAAVFVRPKIRIYQTANVYAEAQRLDRLRKEVQRILAETDEKNQA